MLARLANEPVNGWAWTPRPLQALTRELATVTGQTEKAPPAELCYGKPRYRSS